MPSSTVKPLLGFTIVPYKRLRVSVSEIGLPDGVRNTRSAIDLASVPLTRTIPTLASPSAVAIAAIVSCSTTIPLPPSANEYALLAEKGMIQPRVSKLNDCDLTVHECLPTFQPVQFSPGDSVRHLHSMSLHLTDFAGTYEPLSDLPMTSHPTGLVFRFSPREKPRVQQFGTNLPSFVDDSHPHLQKT